MARLSSGLQEALEQQGWDHPKVLAHDMHQGRAAADLETLGIYVGDEDAEAIDASALAATGIPALEVAAFGVADPALLNGRAIGAERAA